MRGGVLMKCLSTNLPRVCCQGPRATLHALNDGFLWRILIKLKHTTKRAPAPRIFFTHGESKWNFFLPQLLNSKHEFKIELTPEQCSTHVLVSMDGVHFLGIKLLTTQNIHHRFGIAEISNGSLVVAMDALNGFMWGYSSYDIIHLKSQLNITSNGKYDQIYNRFHSDHDQNLKFDSLVFNLLTSQDTQIKGFKHEEFELKTYKQWITCTSACNNQNNDQESIMIDYFNKLSPNSTKYPRLSHCKFDYVMYEKEFNNSHFGQQRIQINIVVTCTLKVVIHYVEQDFHHIIFLILIFFALLFFQMTIQHSVVFF